MFIQIYKYTTRFPTYVSLCLGLVNDYGEYFVVVVVVVAAATAAREDGSDFVLVVYKYYNNFRAKLG